MRSFYVHRYPVLFKDIKYMKRINKITSIGLIITTMWVFLCPGMSYSKSTSLRVPLISNSPQLNNRSQEALDLLTDKSKAEIIKKALLIFSSPRKIKRILVVDDVTKEREKIISSIKKYDDSIEIVEASSGLSY